ncbi:MAG: hypothetical protein K9M98_01675 [Cephaloticoccus sp.]|nr:hypothetical protein [Cephaloticoccus sp.]MCF7759187.1 hypothetical protein [Cephaloticoccus sp.]
MNKPWKVILAFFGVFLAGAVFGGLLVLRVARNHDMKSAAMDRFTTMVLTRYSDRLALTSEQKEIIRPIVMKAEGELRRVRNAGFKETVVIAEKMNEEVAKVLTPEQVGKLQELRKEMSERWKRDRAKRNGGPPRPPPPDGHRPDEPNP